MFSHIGRGIPLKLAFWLVSPRRGLSPLPPKHWSGAGVIRATGWQRLARSLRKTRPTPTGFYEITGVKGEMNGRRHYRTADCRNLNPGQ